MAAMHTITQFLLPMAAMMASAAVGAQEPPRETEKPAPVVKVATLGAATRAPTKDEADELGLKFEVRARGQIVTELVENGPAGKAGLSAGDVLVVLAGVEVFSQDDIADILRVSVPGQKLVASVRIVKTGEQQAMEIVLGAKQVQAPAEPGLAWHYASLVNLEVALAKAGQHKQLVLVGLSGAET